MLDVKAGKTKQCKAISRGEGKGVEWRMFLSGSHMVGVTSVTLKVIEEGKKKV